MATNISSPNPIVPKNPMLSFLPSRHSHTPKEMGNGRGKPLQCIKVTFPLTDEGKEKCMKIIDGM